MMVREGGDGGDLWRSMRTKRRSPLSEGRVVPTLLASGPASFPPQHSTWVGVISSIEQIEMEVQRGSGTHSCSPTVMEALRASTSGLASF